MSARILVVDDEDIVLQSCRRALGDGQRVVDTVSSGAEALKRIEEGRYDVVLLDIMMPDIDGLQVLQRVKESHPDIEVIMVTGLSQIETAVRSMKLGAFDYLPKPFDPDELALVVDRAVERRRLLQENVSLSGEAGSKYRFENIIGSSPRMQDGVPADRPVRADQYHGAHHRERAVPARSSSPAPSTTTACARTSRSCRSIACRSPRTCSKASSSAT